MSPAAPSGATGATDLPTPEGMRQEASAAALRMDDATLDTVVVAARAGLADLAPGTPAHAVQAKAVEAYEWEQNNRRYQKSPEAAASNRAPEGLELRGGADRRRAGAVGGKAMAEKAYQKALADAEPMTPAAKQVLAELRTRKDKSTWVVDKGGRPVVIGDKRHHSGTNPGGSRFRTREAADDARHEHAELVAGTPYEQVQKNAKARKKIRERQAQAISEWRPDPEDVSVETLRKAKDGDSFRGPTGVTIDVGKMPGEPAVYGIRPAGEQTQRNSRITTDVNEASLAAMGEPELDLSALDSDAPPRLTGGAAVRARIQAERQASGQRTGDTLRAEVAARPASPQAPAPSDEFAGPQWKLKQGTRAVTLRTKGGYDKSVGQLQQVGKRWTHTRAEGRDFSTADSAGHDLVRIAMAEQGKDSGEHHGPGRYDHMSDADLQALARKTGTARSTREAAARELQRRKGNGPEAKRKVSGFNELSVVEVVHGGFAVSTDEVAKEFGVSPSAAFSILDALEKKNIVVGSEISDGEGGFHTVGERGSKRARRRDGQYNALTWQMAHVSIDDGSTEDAVADARQRGATDTDRNVTAPPKKVVPPATDGTVAAIHKRYGTRALKHLRDGTAEQFAQGEIQSYPRNQSLGAISDNKRRIQMGKALLKLAQEDGGRERLEALHAKQVDDARELIHAGHVSAEDLADLRAAKHSAERDATSGGTPQTRGASRRRATILGKLDELPTGVATEALAAGPRNPGHQIGKTVWDREKIDDYSPGDEPPVGEIIDRRVNERGNDEYLVRWGDSKTENWESGTVLEPDEDFQKTLKQKRKKR